MWCAMSVACLYLIADDLVGYNYMALGAALLHTSVHSVTPSDSLVLACAGRLQSNQPATKATNNTAINLFFRNSELYILKNKIGAIVWKHKYFPYFILFFPYLSRPGNYSSKIPYFSRFSIPRRNHVLTFYEVQL